MDINLYTDYLNTTTPDSLTSTGTTTKDYSKATDEELMSACKQFEAYFLEQVFKEMEKTIPKEDNEETSSMTDYFKEERLKDLAAQSTEQNSLGLAQSLYNQMKRNYSI